MNNNNKKLLVIGGGAAGFFCAVTAARMAPGLEVVIAEKTGKVLSKVKVSGGGRCNVTHACFDIGEMIRKYPRGVHFLKRTFHQFFTKDTIAWFEERGVELKAEEDGRMFPVTNSSQTIIECLLRETNKYNIQIRMNREVLSLENKNGKWRVFFSGSEYLEVDYICIACGGYSKVTQFRWLLELGHTISQPVPSLFTFNLPGHPIRQLMGVSTEAKVKIAGMKLNETGPVLITHWGLSGPAVLRLSAWGAKELAEKQYDFGIVVNWVPDLDEQTVRAKLQGLRTDCAQKKVTAYHAFNIPQRLWQFLCEQSGISPVVRWGELPSSEQNRLVNMLMAHSFEVQGKTTFKEEFVTAGGIRLQEIDPATMESKKVPGIYFAGEIMDVDGITGGFNFQHAWTSGFIAGKSIATRCQLNN
jgi:predicted Rossmann fold flavoprotein